MVQSNTHGIKIENAYRVESTKKSHDLGHIFNALVSLSIKNVPIQVLCVKLIVNTSDIQSAYLKVQ